MKKEIKCTMNLMYLEKGKISREKMCSVLSGQDRMLDGCTCCESDDGGGPMSLETVPDLHPREALPPGEETDNRS